MASNTASGQRSVSLVEAHFARVAGEGSARHSHAVTLATSTAPGTSRDLADAVHLLCAVHGKFPGLADIACSLAGSGARDWLRSTADSFERERLFLVRLTAAVVQVVRRAPTRERFAAAPRAPRIDHVLDEFDRHAAQARRDRSGMCVSDPRRGRRWRALLPGRAGCP